LEGILAVVSSIGNGSAFGVNETLQKEAFDIWRNSSEDKDSFPEDLSAVSPFAMYTFDAAWTLIQALNKSSFDKNSPSMEESPHCFNSLLKNYSKYHMYLENTHFLGVSGIIQFSKNKSNDRIGGAFYALVNIQQKGQTNGITKRKPRYKQVMIWYETSHSWKSSTGEDKINIIWPGDEFEKVPTDYPQLRG
jgi:predicted outer membrane repeat protein